MLARAAVQLGGVARLAERMNVTPAKLRRYLTGLEAIPDALFLHAIDVVLEQLPLRAKSTRPAAPPLRGSPRDS